ncbi:MAG TPA: class I SAM-dependent methyltransferase [Gemmataceae bacterium]|nr:class I SAM-dependent methyltransferase [Gemmataceae bacterium]
MESDQTTDTGKGIKGAIQSKKPSRLAFLDYRRYVQNHYDGLAGKLTVVTGMLTGHETLAGRLIRPSAFNVSGCKHILDAGCGNGRYTRYLLRDADKDAVITGFDLSQGMLGRARKRVGSPRVSFVSADLTRLPYPDSYFDAVVCGWVLEHLPDPRPGLRELARVMRSGGKLLLLVTEDTLAGSMCSRMWHCRTHNRKDLERVCGECGLRLQRELWFSCLHRVLRLGGIIVELKRD